MTGPKSDGGSAEGWRPQEESLFPSKAISWQDFLSGGTWSFGMFGPEGAWSLGAPSLCALLLLPIGLCRAALTGGRPASCRVALVLARGPWEM